MSLLPDWGKKLWLKTELSPSSTVQRFIVPHLQQVKSVARPLLHPHLNTYLWQGKNQAGDLRVTFASTGPVHKLLKHLLFESEPLEQSKGRLARSHIWELLDDTGSDITIVQADKLLIEGLPWKNSIRLPLYVEWWLNIQGQPEDFKQRLPTHMRREAERLIRKYEYTFETSHKQEDFDTFYHQMYVPSMNSTHGELTDLTPYDEACNYFRQGWLHKVIRQGEFVAGCLVYKLPQALCLKLMGVKNGDEGLRREGVYYAVYYPLLVEANQKGYKFVNVGKSAPFPKLNFFQYKRRWGMAISPTCDNDFQIWFYFHRLTPAVTQFLLANPLVCLQQNGELAGSLAVDDLTALDEAALEKQRHLYLVPGMKDFNIYSVTDLVAT